MGKIRIKTIGADEAPEKKVKKEKEKRKTHLPGMGGGERVVVVGPSEEELAAPVTARKTKKAKFQKQKHSRSKKYQGVVALVEKNKSYSLSEALELLEKLQRKTFDETVELHINTSADVVSSTVTLPHGAGKKTRVAIASDSLLADLEKGKIEFDILLAEPSMMPKLAKVAKVLGPRGLMPNPKNGTITSDPQSIAKKYETGLLHFKTEQKAPILHLSVGKVSFGKTKLKENIETILNAVKKENIQKAVLKSTMSPGIKLQI